MVMSSISRRRSELTGASSVDWVITKAPCWRSRDALLAAETAQRNRARPGSTQRSTRAPIPRSGLVLRPPTAVNEGEKGRERLIESIRLFQVDRVPAVRQHNQPSCRDMPLQQKNG